MTDLIQTLKAHSPIKGRVLASMLGITERELRLQVNYIRRNVTPRITSGDFGYKYETDAKKILDSLKRHKSHAISELEMINKQRQMLYKELQTQLEFRKAG